MLADVREELAILSRVSDEKDELVASTQVQTRSSSPMPHGTYMDEVQDFVQTTPNMNPSDELVMIPVAVLLFTHRSVNADLASGEDHEN